MPRSVTALEAGPGFVSYTLGPRESFTVLALTALADAPTGPNDDDDVFLDYLNPNGDVIHRQGLGVLHQPPAFYSLAVDGEPWAEGNGAVSDWPQHIDNLVEPWIAARLAPIGLTGRCVVRLYASLGQPVPGDDPFATLDTTYVFAPVHLWVADARGSSNLPAPLPPLLTHVQA